MADGTGIPTGRVGSCHIYLKSLRVIWGFFVFYTLIIISAPIPNREVNPPPPRRTNGTGIPTGRVGSCHIYLKEPQSNPGLFCFYTLPADIITVPPSQTFLSKLNISRLRFPGCFKYLPIAVIPRLHNRTWVLNLIDWLSTPVDKRCLEIIMTWVKIFCELDSFSWEFDNKLIDRIIDAKNPNLFTSRKSAYQQW
jgi:hypothetical protein